MKRKITRRDFGKAAIAGVPLAAMTLKSAGVFAAAKPNSKINGVQLGAQTYSFRDLQTIDEVLAALVNVGLSSCELFSPGIEPGGAPAMMGNIGRPATPGGPPLTQAQMQAQFQAMQNSPEAKKRREDLRQWRLTTPASYFEGVRKKFNDAGVDIFAYNISFAADFSDDEINKAFDQARSLGAKFINSSSSVTVAKRIAPFADKQQFRVAWHGHSSKDPDQFASTDSFLTAFSLSKYFWANLDIGHYTAWGGDPVQFLKDHHDRVDNIHLKDRKKNEGANVEWGQGDTPICDVLELLKTEKWPIPAFIEYEYPGKGTSSEEVAKCYAFAKKCLTA
jgi:Xylose isomerase-like TIM barrel